MLVGAPATHGEFDCVGLADDDHTGGDQPPREGRGDRRNAVGPGLGAAGSDSAFQVDDVFQSDGHAVQRADRVTGANRKVGGLGSAAGIVAVNRDEGVQLRVMGRDAGEQRVHEGHRREPACGDLGSQFMNGKKDRVGGRHCMALRKNFLQ